jgi:hypothetical protein
MATRIEDLQAEALVDLLRGLDRVGNSTAVLDDAAPTLVQGILGVDQLPVIGQEIHHAVGRAPFLVRRQRDHDVAVRDEPLALHADQVGHVDGGFVLVVGGAPAVEESVLLDERERVQVPVGGIGLHHVDVSQEQDGPPTRVSAPQPGDQIALAGSGLDDVHVGRVEAGLEQPIRHGLRGRGVVTHRIGRVDFDELLEDLPRQLDVFVGRIGLGRCLVRPTGRQRAAGGQEDHRAHAPTDLHVESPLLGSAIVLGKEMLGPKGRARNTAPPTYPRSVDGEPGCVARIRRQTDLITR